MPRNQALREYISTVGRVSPNMLSFIGALPAASRSPATKRKRGTAMSPGMRAFVEYLNSHPNNGNVNMLAARVKNMSVTPNPRRKRRKRNMKKATATPAVTRLFEYL